MHASQSARQSPPPNGYSIPSSPATPHPVLVQGSAPSLKAAPSAERLNSYIADYTASVVRKLQDLRSEGCWNTVTTSRSIYAGLRGTIVPLATWDELDLSDLTFRISHQRAAHVHETDGDGIPGMSNRSVRHEPSTALAFISLARSLARLPFSMDETAARQAAMQELAANPLLAQKFDDCLNDEVLESLFSAIAGPGDSLTDRFFPKLIAEWFADNRNGFIRLRDKLSAIPEPESPLLRVVLDQLRQFTGSETARLYMEGMRISHLGLTTNDDPRTPLLSVRYRPLLLNPVLSLPYYAPVVLAAAAVPMSLWGGPEIAVLGGKLFQAALGAGVAALAFSVAGGGSAKVLVRDELITKAQRDVPSALGAAALMREMLALNSFTANVTHPSAFLRPLRVNEAVFLADGMGSPLHSEANSFVYNSASISDNVPTLIMGPNSAGKTTWMRSVMTNWIMAMLGARCFASGGSFSPASRLIMSVPKQSAASALQGRFGEELAWLRPELLRGPDERCVIGFDEIGSGTAEAAAASIGIPIIDTLREHGCRIIIASHNSSLKEALAKSGISVHALHPEVMLITKPDGSIEADSSHRVLEGHPDSTVPPEGGAWRVLSEMGLSRNDLGEFRKKAQERRRQK